MSGVLCISLYLYLMCVCLCVYVCVYVYVCVCVFNFASLCVRVASEIIIYFRLIYDSHFNNDLWSQQND